MEPINNSNNIEDEIALRNLMAKYVDAVNRIDPENWISCWAEDASWNLMGNPISGKDTILGLWQQMMSGFEFALMVPSSCLFNINNDEASGHWYLQEFTRDKQGKSMSIVSRYTDTYKKIEGQWLYQSRVYEIIYLGDEDLKGQYTPIN